MSGIFISYRREDSDYIAGRLHDRLTAHFGTDKIFRDIDTMGPGVEFPTRIEQALNSCTALVALIGTKWLAVTDPSGRRRIDDPKDFVRIEIAAALKRDVLVVPVLVQNAQMPSATELPTPLKKLVRRNAVEISDARWSYEVQRLIEGLQVVVPGPGEESAAGSAAGDSVRQAADSLSCVVRWAHPAEMEAAGANRLDKRYGVFLSNPSNLPARDCTTALWSIRAQNWLEIEHRTIPAADMNPDPYILNLAPIHRRNRGGERLAIT